MPQLGAGRCHRVGFVTTRRQFLLHAGAGAAGVAALGAGAGVLDVRQQDRSARATAMRGEAADAAAVAGRRVGMLRTVWSTTPAGPWAAITFDDGPTPAYTPRVLDALATAGVHATFFLMGHNAQAHPSLVGDIVAAGHEVGNHTWSHLDQSTLNPAQIREEIVRGRDAVEQVAQQRVVGFRPPRGELAGYALMVCAELGHDVFLWSCTRGPSGVSTPSAVTEAIATGIRRGDVLDLHDGLGRGTFAPDTAFTRALAARREVEVRALPDALARIAHGGLQLTSVTGLLSRSAPEPLPSPGRRPVQRH